MALDCHVTVSDSYLGTEVALEATISQGLELACDILWMISVIIAAAVSLSNISALRSRRLPGGDLKGWATALYVALFIQATLGIVFSSYYFWPIILGNNLFLALSFISGLALVLVFIILLCIGKHNSWNQTVEKPEQLYAPVMQQHATYGHGNGQQDYYQQTPELVHAR
ncbi:hypothetical protein J4E91_006669 [Alternaria rosae]|nr:hypothetical protein J4E91_006669 [Alternaria rosae]